MIIVGFSLPSGEVSGVKPSELNLELGTLLTGRVAQVGAEGGGLLRLPDGATLAFSGGRQLMVGEQLRLQVVQLTPQINLQIVAGESATANKLAEGIQQGLVRAPDLLASLVRLAEGGEAALAGEPSPLPSSLPSAAQNTTSSVRGTLPDLSPALASAALQKGNLTGFPPLPAGAGASSASLAASLSSALLSSGDGRWVTDQGDSLASLLQKNLPSLSLPDLVRGDAAIVQRLLDSHLSRQEEMAAIRRLRQAAATLHWEAGGSDGSGNTGAARGAGSEEEATARHALRQLGDLLAAQDLLPRHASQPDESRMLGYRLFWFPEGGLGEAIWRQRRKGGGGQSGGADELESSVLLSLNMSRLGSVQARLTYGEGHLHIGIAAAQEDSLAGLRQQIALLRDRLQAAGLPLRRLDLSRINPGELRMARQEMLGVGGGFLTEA